MLYFSLVTYLAHWAHWAHWVGWGGPSQVELIGHVIHNILFCYPFLDS